jgi:hypothetical protein
MRTNHGYIFIIIINNSEDEIHRYMAEFNNMHEKISLTYEISNTSSNFLDVTVVLENGSLYTKAYRKPTDRPQYLHFGSNHHHHTKSSLPYSLSLRYKRICSRQEHLSQNLNQLKNTFLSKAYPEGLIDDAITKACNAPMLGNIESKMDHSENLIIDSVDNDNEKGKIRFITTYSASNPQFRQIFQNSLSILHSHPSKIFEDIKIDTVFRRAKSINDRLVHSALNHFKTKQSDGGMVKCNRSRCKCCDQLNLTNTARSTSSNYKFNLATHYNCMTSNCVYLLECSMCSLQYIGETAQPFHKRLNGHRSDANQKISTRTGKVIGKIDLPIFKHVKNTGHSFDSFTAIILKSDFKSEDDRLFYESFCISKFNTFEEGLNEDCGITKF